MTNIPLMQRLSNDQKQLVVSMHNSGSTQKEIGEEIGLPRRSVIKVCKALGLSRSVKEAASLKTKSDFDSPEIINRIRELRPTHTLQQIADIIGSKLGVVDRICQKYDIPKPENFSELQSARMKAAWTDEKRKEMSVQAKERMTPEVRDKIRQSTKEKWQDKDYREKQITIQSKIWASAEKRQLMRDRLIEIWADVELRRIMSETQKKVWADPELRQRMSVIQKEIWADPEKRAYIRKVQTELWDDIERRQRVSDLNTKLWSNQELRLADSEAQKKVWENQDYKEKMSTIMKLRWENPEFRQRMSAIFKSFWDSPDYRNKMAVARANQPRVSNIQEILYSILDDLGIPHFKEYEDKPNDPETIIGPYNFDCVVPLEGRKTLLIECHGDYWHSLEKAIRNDKSKATYISKYFSDQYELKCLWEHEFLCKNRIIENIKRWVGIKELEIIDFSFSDVTINPQPDRDAVKLLLSKYHYLPFTAKGGHIFGAYLGDELIAVCIFSPLVRQNVRTDEFSKMESLELSRLCIHPNYQKKNFASWFVSRCLKQLPSSIKLIISYCDTTYNHDGAVYKALNFTLDGIVPSDYWYVDYDGWVMHKRKLYSHAVKMSMKEADFAEKHGYKKVFGSEKLRFIYKR